MLVTARNAIHEVLVDDLREAIGAPTVNTLRLDILKQNECEWFVKALNEYGLWGELAGDSSAQKLNFVMARCHSQIHALLLKMLSAPEIHNKLRALSDSLATNNDVYNIMISIFVLAAINYTATLDTLADIWGVEIVGSSGFRNNTNVRQLIDFSLDRIAVRSATAAQYFLSKVVHAPTAVSAMITMATRADAHAATMVRHKNLTSEPMKFRNLQNIFSEEGRTAALFKFYESVKNLTTTKSNPLFWLQYAIASMAAGDLVRAKESLI